MNEKLLEIVVDAVQVIDEAKVTFLDKDNQPIYIDYVNYVLIDNSDTDWFGEELDNWGEIYAQQSKIKYINIPHPSRELFNAFYDLHIMYDDGPRQLFDWDCQKSMFLKYWDWDKFSWDSTVWIDLLACKQEYEQLSH